MSQIAIGDIVHIHYTGTLLDGTQFDSSEGREPLSFEVGSGQIIAGLDAAMPGMSLGEKKTVKVPCLEAYGPINPAMRDVVPRSAVPEDIELSIGMQLQMQTPEGQALPVTVVDLSDEEITLDANHPLAGQDLIFDIEVMAIGG